MWTDNRTIHEIMFSQPGERWTGWGNRTILINLRPSAIWGGEDSLYSPTNGILPVPSEIEGSGQVSQSPVFQLYFLII